MKLCLTFIICVGLYHIDSVTVTKEKDDSDWGKKSKGGDTIEDVMQELQDTCNRDKRQRTIEKVKLDTQTILNNIATYKEVVKMNQQVRSEIKWIIDESKGQKELARIIRLMKRDIRNLCLPKHRDCKELSKRHLQSGVYKIYPDKMTSLEVYCDMETDGGGWTVFQRRVDGKTDFQRDWASYKNGFGNLEKEFWLGNDKLSQLTENGQYELRVDLENFSGATVYAKYSDFQVQDELTKYKLTVFGYSGTAGDSMTYHNGQRFTTKDRDNDNWPNNCASDAFKGGWWYKDCGYSALNGLFGTHNQYSIFWLHWKENVSNIKTTSMMFRRLS